jgi:3-mercaptopyruvate sulfurtransferase SseA
LNNRLLPILLIAVGVLLLIGAVVSVVFLRSPDSAAYLVDPGAEGSYPEVTRVSLTTAKDAFDTGAAVFVDVRGREYYENGHIPGAKSIPLGEVEQRRSELDPNDWIILYCT